MEGQWAGKGWGKGWELTLMTLKTYVVLLCFGLALASSSLLFPPTPYATVPAVTLLSPGS